MKSASRRGAIAFCAAIACVSTFVFAGCKVHYTFSGASVPVEAKTFSLATFRNSAPTVNPRLASLLTLGVEDLVMSASSLAKVTYDADIAFQGTITGYHLSPVALQGGEVTVAAKNRLTITVNVKYTSRYSPKDNFETSFSQYEEYDTTLDFIAVEDQLMESIVEKLANDIFNKAFVNW